MTNPNSSPSESREQETFAATMRAIYGNEFPTHPNSTGEYPGWHEHWQIFQAGAALAPQEAAVAGADAMRLKTTSDALVRLDALYASLCDESPERPDWLRAALRVARGEQLGVAVNATPSTPEPAAASEAVAEVVSWTNGSYWRNYKLNWLRDVPAGTKLYAAPTPGGESVEAVREAAHAVIAWWDEWAARQPQDDAIESAEWSQFNALRAALRSGGNGEKSNG